MVVRKDSAAGGFCRPPRAVMKMFEPNKNRRNEGAFVRPAMRCALHTRTTRMFAAGSVKGPVETVNVTRAVPTGAIRLASSIRT